jgi:hypothetical protein
MKNVPTALLTVCLLSGCGEKKEFSVEAADAPQTTEKKSDQKVELSPEELGAQIGDLYVTTMEQLIEMLKDKPDAAEAMPKVQVLKDECITKLVALGKKREALDEAGRKKVDLQVKLKMPSYSNPLFDRFNDVQMHYAQNEDFQKLILSFNIITQYANFDLLKKQEPKEAERLGIE